MSNLRYIRATVKEYMGIPDLPDALIDDWVRAGLDELNAVTTWPWQKKVVTVTVPASGTVDNGVLLERCTRVIKLSSTTYGAFPQIELGEALDRWPRVNVDASSPQVYTISATSNGQKLRLWPGGGDDSYPCNCQYYEWPEPWPGEATTPLEELPIAPKLHRAVERWVHGEALLREGQIKEAEAMRAVFYRLVHQESDNVVVVPERIRVGSDRHVGLVL